MMTDAIARWAYKRQEEHGDAPFFLKAMNTQKEIEELCDVQRGLLDSDVTLLRILLT
jgi:hypothetical protein